MPGSRDTLRGVVAFDTDRDNCSLHQHHDECLCGDVMYVMVEAKDMPWRFRINPTTGAVNYNLYDRPDEDDYYLTIAAANVLPNGTLDMKNVGFSSVVLKARHDARLHKEGMLRYLHPKYDVTSWSGAPHHLELLKLHRRRKRAVVCTSGHVYASWHMYTI